MYTHTHTHTHTHTQVNAGISVGERWVETRGGCRRRAHGVTQSVTSSYIVSHHHTWCHIITYLGAKLFEDEDAHVELTVRMYYSPT